jgi:hypothetical protein
LPTGRARAAAFSRFAPVFGTDLGAEPRWLDALARALDALSSRGVMAALEEHRR